MKRILSKILPVFLCLPLVSTAQYYELPDTVIIDKKNTVGLYVSPVAGFMMNSFILNPRYGVQYKRWLNEYKRLRLSVVHDVVQYEYDNNKFSPSNFVQSTGSTIMMLSEWRQQRKTTLRAGIEWTQYTKKIDSFFGFDIIAGYKTDEYYMDHTAYDYYTSTGSQDTANYIQANPAKSYRPYSYYNQYIELGIAPVIGWRFDVKNNWEFAVNVSPEVTVAIPVANQWKGDWPMPIESAPDTEIEFRLRLLEMVLSYRF